MLFSSIRWNLLFSRLCALYFALFSFILYTVDRNNAILSFIYYIRLMEMLTRRAKVRIGNIFLRIMWSTVTNAFEWYTGTVKYPTSDYALLFIARLQYYL